MEALHDCVRAGKVRYIGASSMFAWQFAKAQHVATVNRWTPFVSMQNHYNLLYREEEREMLPQCRDMGVAVLPWSPLARGVLARPPESGSSTRSKSDTFSAVLYGGSSQPDILQAVGSVAKRHGITRAQVALAWLRHQPGVTAPIVGATKMSHLTDAIESVEVVLQQADLDALCDHYGPRPVLGHD
jgi:aryl-alcohol dehydrogenase (NADP+)